LKYKLYFDFGSLSHHKFYLQHFFFLPALFDWSFEVHQPSGQLDYQLFIALRQVKGLRALALLKSGI
jgi:hypothetical protein